MKARIIHCTKERPTLFNDTMVWSILTGRKTATLLPTHFVANKGDVLWVREAWAPFVKLRVAGGERLTYLYRSTPPNLPEWPKPKWRPSILMPREACRIFLEVVDVRKSRLQDMTEGDAIREGVWFDAYQDGWIVGREGCCFHASQPLRSFEKLWQSCYGDTKLDWETNPVVKVIEFKRAEVKK